MAINLKTLIHVSPFSDIDREKMLSKIDSLNEDQKIHISEVCWKLLSFKYYTQLQFMIDEYLDEVQTGQKKYNLNDVTEIEARCIHDYAQKLQVAETEGSIEEVRTQLEKFKTHSLPQDKTVSTSLTPKP
ncbi:hypothetical protein A2960_06115 [Candidatus Gottesmanbacteria bacterium RIFCSPLOWO2_01_FULL_39_12b]|uniref:Uncharacterized protein n=1 Tax=Candidatus Gottesmanbacteria bacterium RIFCSPLOWO2_01_FULL_39_12b TaxID=1798388 RepID=A0A1F6AP10_9BACT|nr:MAG: hypothetical protein A2960_06115 [Candidatus Gottesmanbacteria bacterium RIFCSPLOWO2_01_FULL_39_12b]